MARKLLVQRYANSKLNFMTTPFTKTADKKDSVETSLNTRLPERFPVSVIMQSQPSSHPWANETWDAIGVVSHNSNDKHIKEIKQGKNRQVIYSNLNIRLYLDECESYYHNMMSPEPGCFIVARAEDEDGNDTDVPIPVLVTLSFDEAHAYLEGEDIVYAVPIPAELYRWAEAYVLKNYSAEKRKKRKRKNWKEGET